MTNVMSWLLAAAMAIGSPAARAAAADAKDIVVHVQRVGAWVRVDVEFVVEATPAEAWNVLTDYDHMAKIVSNVEQSRIIKREGDKLEVAQKGKAGIGPISMSFDIVREVVLTPFQEIHSRLISGDMKSSEFTTRLSSEGKATRVVNHGEYLPKIWVPPMIGPAFIEAETRKQYQELRAEMLRRKAAP